MFWLCSIIVSGLNQSIKVGKHVWKKSIECKYDLSYFIIGIYYLFISVIFLGIGGDHLFFDNFR